jgi:hypothetical protein
MLRTARSRLALYLLTAVAVGLAVPGTASAHGLHPQQLSADTTGEVTYLVAALNGRNEVPGSAGSPAAGDSDGRAIEVLRIKGNQVSFAIKWTGIGAPTAGHLHLGAAGANGAMKVSLFGAPLPATLNAVVGTVTVDDGPLLDSLKSDPGTFYTNLHNGEFPGGAVRGQLHKVTHPVDLTAVLRGGPLAAMLDPGQEVPTAGKPSGDPDGHASAFLRAGEDNVTFAFSWSGLSGPTNGHLHQGAVGANGPVALELFAAPGGLPASVTGVAGVVDDVKDDLTEKINKVPSSFYLNLHTAEFTGGAVRGQLFRSGRGTASFHSSSFIAPVIKGEQIYACTRQADGSFAYTQHNVSARLQGGIRHSFVNDVAGPPQWIARDRSAVTGKVLTRTLNGAGNIPELDLDAAQTGASSGLFAGVVEIERLNTVGGVAPTGACDPARQPTAKVPYEADYVFLT